MKNKILIGCSSYNNRYWKGIFYPDNVTVAGMFGFYSQHFSTYEFNGSFYRFPTLKVFTNWYNKAPEDFLFSVKAPKDITHIKQFIDCENLLSEFYNVCKMGLKEKLACVLFQFPPSYQFTLERLNRIIKNLDLSFQNVIEFRHESWWNNDVWNAFLENNITFCSVSHPQLPQTIFKNFPLIYIRLHGVPKMFYSSYPLQELLNIRYETHSKSGFIYFNNTAGEAGILNALELKNLI
ncbi:uncharacterized protein YecE (DUF72 family) [Flavobacterium sp. HSC-32F16]|uniref:DUF72 domain-containing protein n=1 Tax=Flavobacterium sp. HSC-32F16 TaxID=2910964 RepID=UPI0020A30EA2|nr:DUF72 domain-containing protein [Flavobacterium sp. HSC-32F16]MCP2025569.1 uncharacterized protein YecE (DUF72 family) [Flavobacterium sp. HSC-32F16]